MVYVPTLEYRQTSWAVHVTIQQVRLTLGLMCLSGMVNLYLDQLCQEIFVDQLCYFELNLMQLEMNVTNLWSLNEILFNN